MVFAMSLRLLSSFHRHFKYILLNEIMNKRFESLLFINYYGKSFMRCNCEFFYCIVYGSYNN